MSKRELVVATGQFPVSKNIGGNLSYIVKLIHKAKEKGAEVVHFSESSLSGYAGVDFERLEEQNETLLRHALKQILALAARLKIWVVVGSHHYEGQNDLPYNCLWVIDDCGSLIALYDKRFWTGGPGELDHAYYKPGQDPVTFTIKGITCGLLICHEWRYPELYREQNRLGTEVLFQSWYDGSLSAEAYKAVGRDLGSLIVGTVRGRAANNALWISASNTSMRESCFASFMVQPDGRILRQLKRNVTGLIISHIDLNKNYSDPSGPWRDRAVQGIFHNDVLEG